LPHKTERIIELLETVNTTAVNSDDGTPGEFLASCAARLPNGCGSSSS
jgi:hypothetical protein